MAQLQRRRRDSDETRAPWQTSIKMRLLRSLLATSVPFLWLMMMMALLGQRQPASAQGHPQQSNFSISMRTLQEEHGDFTAGATVEQDADHQTLMPPLEPQMTSRVQQRYTLFYKVDGPSGLGSFSNRVTNGADLLQLFWFMQNLTQDFVPVLASQEEVANVTTFFHWVTQKSFDHTPDLPPAEPGATYYEPISRKRTGGTSGNPYQARQIDPSTLLSLLGNTTYGVIYYMNYTSPTVNVENYTDYYETTIYQSFDKLARGLRQWLTIPDTSNVTISGVYRSPEELPPPPPPPSNQTVAPTAAPTTAVELLQTLDEREDEIDEANLLWDIYNDTLDGDISRNYTNTTATLPPTIIVDRPFLVPANASKSPTVAPTDTWTPSAAPTISNQPTISSMPSPEPSFSPTESPTQEPTLYPSFHPTFFEPSTQRQKYFFTLRMDNVSHPKKLFDNNTLMCEFFISLTPEIVEPGQNPDQVVTTCPNVNRQGWSFVTPQTRAPSRTLTPQETLAPTVPLYDDDTVQAEYLSSGIGDENEAIEATETEPPAEYEEDFNSDNSTRYRLRGRRRRQRQRQLQQEQAGISFNDSGVVPPETNLPDVDDVEQFPSILYQFSIVMRWTSEIWDVSTYAGNLRNYMLVNSTEVEFRMEYWFDLDESDGENLTLVEFRPVFDVTKAPSAVPSQAPSSNPSFYETDPPTFSPTTPTLAPTPLPARAPNMNISDPIQPGGGVPGSPAGTGTPEVTVIPNTPARDDTTVIIVVVIVVVILSSMLMVALFVFYRQRRDRMREIKKMKQQQRRASEGAAAAVANHHPAASPTADTIVSPARTDGGNGDGDDPVPASKLLTEDGSSHRSLDEDASHSNSNVLDSSSNGVATSNGVRHSASNGAPTSNGVNNNNNNASKLRANSKKNIKKSLLTGSLLSDIDEDPYDEEPTTDDNTTQSPPIDEFERYKDRNLEKMRSNVEDNVTGLDDMMSQAMTMALMMDGGTLANSVPYWHGATSGVEIEANALWEVTEWLKRQGDSAGEDDKQVYMQSLLNKMVTSVRKGVVDPEDASRTIHECAHLLGLKLANQLPVTTIILSGMQKTTTSADVLRTFKAIGPVETAAVASNQRGFGLVRFKNQRAAIEAMEQSRRSEVVVKNVGITLKMLSPLDLAHHR